MSSTETPERQTGNRIVTHLDITINLDNPPPAASQSFAKTHHQVTTTWEKFESAANMSFNLTSMSSTMSSITFYHVSTPLYGRFKAKKLASRYIFTSHEPRIEQAESCCQYLDIAIKKLQEAALKESEVMEDRAALEIDVGVMRKCLATTREILEVAQAQLGQSRSSLSP
jgi:hypothetical protein